MKKIPNNNKYNRSRSVIKEMKKLFCKLFGHPDRGHYHRPTDVFVCNGGCEKYEIVNELLPCPRCGSILP